VTSKLSGRIAADTNVLLAAALGMAAARVFSSAMNLRVVTTEANIEEAARILPRLSKRYGLEPTGAEANLLRLPLQAYTASAYESHLEEASQYLAKRDPTDIPLAALALRGRPGPRSRDRRCRKGTRGRLEKDASDFESF
jgi:predicted nucleic acid-binding protein